VIAEVAGPDLRLATFLSARWDGYNASLAGRVTEYLSAVECALELDARWRAGSGRPPPKLRPAWQQGLADRWEGDVRVSPAALPKQNLDAELDRLVWRGQARALNPVVDQFRLYLEERIKAGVNAGSWRELTADDDRRSRPTTQPARPVLELNRMAWGVHTGRVRLTRADEDLLFCLRNTRNSLAHLVPLTDANLERLTHVVSKATISW
jgi:hypothetical protein